MKESIYRPLSVLIFISLALFLVYTACETEEVEEEEGTTEETTEEEIPFKILGVYPPDNAMAVPKNVEIKVTFSKEYEGDFSRFIFVLETADGYEVPTQPELHEDMDKVTVNLLEELADDTEYFITIDHNNDGEIDWESDFTTHFPDGTAFNIVIGFSIEKIGANEELLEFIESQLDPDKIPPILMIAVDYFTSDPFPWEDFMMAGGIDEDKDDGIYSIDPEYGLPIVVTGCQVDSDGILSSPPQDFIIPINIEPVEATLYISETTFSGTMYRNEETELVEGITDFVIDGLILEEDIEKIAQETEYGALLENLLVPDVDTDGDGIYDGVTIKIRSQPVVVEITRVQE